MPNLTIMQVSCYALHCVSQHFNTYLSFKYDTISLKSAQFLALAAKCIAQLLDFPNTSKTSIIMSTQKKVNYTID